MHPTIGVAVGLNYLRSQAKVRGPNVGAVLQRFGLGYSAAHTIGNPDFRPPVRLRMRTGRVGASGTLEDAIAQDQAAIQALNATISALRDSIAAFGVDENGNATDSSMQPSVDALQGQVNQALSDLAQAQQALAADQAALAQQQANPGPLPGGSDLPGFNNPPAPQPVSPPFVQPSPAPTPFVPAPVTPALAKSSNTKYYIAGAAVLGAVGVFHKELGLDKLLK